MKLPEMIMFDYGHTLCHARGWDTLKGQKALFEYVVYNKNNITPEEVAAFSDKLFGMTREARNIGFEIHERQFQRFLYDYLGIGLSISYDEAERVFWNASVPDAFMPGTDTMLDFINEKGIRSAVISNTSYSGDAMKDRLDRILPNNRFEFVIASSDYAFRKPSKLLFGLALSKAGLAADKVWYCGDNPQLDVTGASGAGIFPVWYDSSVECGYRDKSIEKIPECENLRISEWKEMTDILEKL